MRSVNGFGRQNITRHKKSIVLSSFICIKTTKTPTFKRIIHIVLFINLNNAPEKNNNNNTRMTPSLEMTLQVASRV